MSVDCVEDCLFFHVFASQTVNQVDLFILVSYQISHMILGRRFSFPYSNIERLFIHSFIYFLFAIFCTECRLLLFCFLQCCVWSAWKEMISNITSVSKEQRAKWKLSENQKKTDKKKWSETDSDRETEYTKKNPLNSTIFHINNSQQFISFFSTHFVNTKAIAFKY